MSRRLWLLLQPRAPLFKPTPSLQTLIAASCFGREDLDELLTLSDRLLVMHSGKIVGEFDPVNSERHDIGAAMAGEAQT